MVEGDTRSSGRIKRKQEKIKEEKGAVERSVQKKKKSTKRDKYIYKERDLPVEHRLLALHNDKIWF